jgi:hypothetical protein
MSDIIQFAPPDEQEPGEALALKMVELINAEESNVNVLSALMYTLTAFLGRICPDCRRRVVKGLKKELPRMVRTANELAEYDDGGACH